MLLLYRCVLLGEAARSLNKASFTWLPMIQAEVKGMTRFNITVACFQVCWQRPPFTLLCRRVCDVTAASEAPIQRQVWPFKLLSRCFSSTVLHARAQTLSSHVISSTSVNKEQAPGFLQVASAIGLYYKLATEKVNCIGGLVCVGFCFKLPLVLQY